ncbi:MAG TPA: hypothetical protein VNZ63_09225, partial [Verrucomicrobiae bacterium]|nr:hypothetical protein [Verrucomicrobiae bacterium]
MIYNGPDELGIHWERTTLENLVPRAVYDFDESGYRQRLGLVSGLVFGLAIGISCLLITPPTVGFGLRVLTSVCAAAFGGVAFGNIFLRRFRKRMSSIIDRLYAGDVETYTPPPEKDLRYRLPCSWKRSEKFAVGGVLYIGTQGL